MGIGDTLPNIAIVFLWENVYSARVLVGPAYPLYNIKERKVCVGGCFMFVGAREAEF